MTTILVVDDDPAIVRLVTLVLKSASFDVRRAFDGREALSQLLAGGTNPDLVVLDLSMPVMDGRHFYAEARSAGYQGPVIVCSAHGAREACLELGAQASVSKPFDPDVLLETIREQLD